MDRKAFGKKGEEKAVRYLAGKGYDILARNYLKRSGEIDLIARDPASDEIVFAEVKTRHNRAFGYPEEAVDEAKIEKIIETAEQWLTEKNQEDRDWRIDIISIEWDNGEALVQHFENISL
ncbi:YraN family protein [Candidatus Peregrinibacteria bacterium]|nr:YraN family protein [Candidatus Peregrinibacteria bacterium]